MEEDRLTYLATKLGPYLRDAFESPGASVVGLRRAGDGWENEVFAFSLKGVEADRPRDLVLRAFQGAQAPAKSSREFDVIRKLHGAGYPVPAVYAPEPTGAVIGQPFFLMDFVDGKPLGLGPWMHEELGERFCGMFADLRSLDWHRAGFPSSFGAADSGQMVDTREVVGCWIDRSREVARSFGVEDLDGVFDWLGGGREKLGMGRLSITHGDYHPFNILVRGDGAAYVIDWTNAEVTDYRFDLAWTLVLLWSYDGQRARDTILARYEGAAGHKADQIEYFEAIASLRRLFSIVVSVTVGAEKLGMRPGAEERMLAQMTHVERVYEIFRLHTGLRLGSVERLLAQERG